MNKFMKIKFKIFNQFLPLWMTLLTKKLEILLNLIVVMLIDPRNVSLIYSISI